MIKLFNTLNNKKEEFISLEPGKVKMYVCGPTVYNYIHIGNARVFIVFDLLRRFLQHKGYDVTYVQNFTDVDDKLINAAIETGRSVEEIAEMYIEAYYADMDALQVHRADVHPRATDYISDMITAIQQLIEQDFAYVVEGDVYFRSTKKSDYGKLSGQSLQDLKIGARVDVNEKKEHPLDFVLWKSAKPGEVSWHTPWGKSGRPGWHIECSVMAKKYLGDTLDIHAGGTDLCFPHHENEIAQSESLTGKTFANYWLHNGFIQTKGEKMAKSLGNVKQVVELLQQYSTKSIRYFLLSAHYRQPIAFSRDVLLQAEAATLRLQTAVDNALHRRNQLDGEEVDEQLKQSLTVLSHRFEQEMSDDLNTANAITVFFEVAKLANEWTEKREASRGSLQAILDWFTLYGEEIFGLVTVERHEILDLEIDRLIEERHQARINKNYTRADEIRDQLSAKGIYLEDTSQGVRWKRR